jgi:2-(1,2-epoxy-1,2-dihydrophenyl)acetyl-CoA isomerase
MAETNPGETLVRLSFDGGAAQIVLDRPGQLNAMNEDMVRQLLSAIDEVESSSARALLFSATGRAFSAGRDIAGAQPGTEDGGQVLAEVFNPLVQRVADLAFPTVAAVQGACLGAGLGLALACDVMIVADNAKIGSPFARIGAVLDSGGHKAFVQRLGPARALDLIYSGRLISGQQAAEWGLASRSVPADELDAVARQYVYAVAAGPVLAFAESKRLVRQIADRPATLAEVLASEAQAQSRSSATRDYVEGFTAFLERREPRFAGE